MEVILTPIYEEEFLGISYGFRPGRGAHDALDALAYAIEQRKVNWILARPRRAVSGAPGWATIPRISGRRSHQRGAIGSSAAPGPDPAGTIVSATGGPFGWHAVP